MAAVAEYRMTESTETISFPQTRLLLEDGEYTASNDEEGRHRKWDNEKATIADLERMYDFLDYREVSDYLMRHPELIPLLFELCDEIQEHFGDDYQGLMLEVFTDEEDGSQELFVLVETALPVREAINRRRALDAEWWPKVPRAQQCQFNIDVEYV